MDNVVQIKNAILAAFATIGTVVANALGGWDMALTVLIWCMAIDYLTGIVVAAVFRKSPKSEGGALESRAGFKGLIRKGGILLVVLVSALLDKLVGGNYIRAAVCLFFVANEGLSILENVGLMGVPLPKFLAKMLEALKDKADSGEGDKV